jgi:hypothetical protein
MVIKATNGINTIHGTFGDEVTKSGTLRTHRCTLGYLLLDS